MRAVPEGERQGAARAGERATGGRGGRLLTSEAAPGTLNPRTWPRSTGLKLNPGPGARAPRARCAALRGTVSVPLGPTNLCPVSSFLVLYHRQSEFAAF